MPEQPRLYLKLKLKAVNMNSSDYEMAEPSSSLTFVPGSSLAVAPRPLAIDSPSGEAGENGGPGQSSEVVSSDPVEDLHFSSFREAEDRLVDTTWKPPAVGVPKTPEEEKVYIRQLVKAFMCTSVALDSARGVYWHRFKSDYYTPEGVEFCAWNILQLVRDLHSDGFRPYIFDKEVIISAGATKEFTFKRRIDDICEVLKISKYAAVQVLKGEKILSLVYYPDKLYNSILSNATSNAKRSNWIISGRNADENHQPKPKRRKMADGNASSASLPSATAASASSDVAPEANAPSKFTPINGNPPPVARPPKKRRAKKDTKDKVAFKPVAGASTVKSDSTSKATAANSNSTQVPSNGMAVPYGDRLSSTAAGKSAKTVEADNMIPGTPSFVKKTKNMPVPDLNSAEVAEALSLLRSGKFVDDMNKKYGR